VFVGSEARPRYHNFRIWQRRSEDERVLGPQEPLDLTDEELRTAATACRALVYQEGERAKKMENPGMRRRIENTQMRLRTFRVMPVVN